jgi:tetratricopeptide (TPR) repeat protein
MKCYRTLLVTAALASLFIATASSAAEKEIDDAPVELLEYCTEKIQHEPAKADWYECRGVAYEEKHQYDLAIGDYGKAISLDPGRAIFYLKRASVYGKKELYGQAIHDYTSAIKLDGKSFIAYSERGTAYGKLGEYDAALADLGKAIELQPDSSDLYLQRGSINETAKKYRSALADYTKASALAERQHDDGQRYDALVRCGMVYGLSKDFDRAIDNFNAAIAVDPGNGMAYYQRALIYKLQGIDNKALGDLKKGCELSLELACKEKDAFVGRAK